MRKKPGNPPLSPYRLDKQEFSKGEPQCISQALTLLHRDWSWVYCDPTTWGCPFLVLCSKSVLSEFLIIITSQNRSSLFSSHSRLNEIGSD